MLEETANVTCPYCGEAIDLAVDVSAGSQSYIEDCQVCCQPMNVNVSVDADGDVAVTVSRDDV
jgi:uncharacterized Zn finger protein